MRHPFDIYIYRDIYIYVNKTQSVYIREDKTEFSLVCACNHGYETSDNNRVYGSMNTSEYTCRYSGVPVDRLQACHFSRDSGQVNYEYSYHRTPHTPHKQQTIYAGNSMICDNITINNRIIARLSPWNRSLLTIELRR
jgi:hypothetical protein